MQVKIASYPPLGQVTKLLTPELEFTCVLDVDSESASDSWQVLLRYTSIGSEEWEEKDLARSKQSLFNPQGPRDVGRAQVLFEGKIHIAQALRFELKFRQNSVESWLTNGEDSMPDSIMLLTPEIQRLGEKSHDINDYMKDLNPDLRTRLLESGSESGILSWLVEVPVEAARGEIPHMEQVMFGKPFGGEFLRWFGISRNTTSWMAPRQGRTYFKLDVAGILCSFLNSQGEHLIALGISGFENVMTIFGDNNEGAMMIKIRNERQAPGFGRVVVSVGNDFETTLASTLAQARTIFGLGETPNGTINRKTRETLERDWADQWINGLIYSPKNDASQKRSEEEVVASLNDLTARGITVSSLILDDVWQTVDTHQPSRYHAGLLDFEADPVAFKSGLKHAVAEIKRKHESIRSVIVWHPIFGHWGGISEHPEGSIKHAYETVRVQRSEAIQPGSPSVLTIEVVSPEDVRRFYSDYYKFLSSCGVSAVQCDAFYMLESLKSAIMRCSLAETYLDAQSAASLEHFPGGTLTSMSLSPSALLNNLKSSHTCRQTVRNIGVFPDHRKYVFANASNALLSVSIGNIPDWGLVQSTRDYGAFHVAARSISGGPIQIASFDDLNAADLELVSRISGRTAKGKTVVLRPTGTGRTMNAYVAFEDEALLRIGNSHSMGTSEVSILGIFNTSDRPIMELLRVKDFPGVNQGQEYIIRSSSGVISSQLRADSTSSIFTKLDVSEYEILCAHPVVGIIRAEGEETVRVAVLGLRGKLIGAAAVIDSTYEMDNGTLRVRAVLKVLGVLEIYISDLSRQICDDQTCTIKVQGKEFAPSALGVGVDDRVLHLDLESIWEEQKLHSETDEIYVEVTLSRQ